MTEQQYNRANEINESLSFLNSVKAEINKPGVRLDYVRTLIQVGCEINVTDGKITDILDRHDKMIREEIDSEIEKLKKEIEEL